MVIRYQHTLTDVLPFPACSPSVPLFEVPVLDPVGEAFPADPDALQHSVTAQLVHHQGVLHGPRSLGLVGDDAADKVRVCGP